MTGYYVKDGEEIEGMADEYSALYRPDGTRLCFLSEPEDREWFRDLKPVVMELNSLNVINKQMLEALEAIANEDNVYTKRNQYRLCCKFQGIAIAAIKVVKDEI